MIALTQFEGPWQYDTLLQRPEPDQEQLSGRVEEIMQQVKAQGDAAVLAYTLQFDGLQLVSLAVSDAEKEAGIAALDPQLKAAIDLAINNIRIFHEAQREPRSGWKQCPAYNAAGGRCPYRP